MPGPRPRGEAGMTLVEMLVVLAIIGIAAGATVLAIGSAERGPNVEAEARRLAARIQFAADRAMLSDTRLALQASAGGYGFVTLDPRGRWALAGGDALGPHRLPAGITLATPGDGPMPIGFDGAGVPIAAVLRGRGQGWTVAYDGLNVAVAPAGPVS